MSARPKRTAALRRAARWRTKRYAKHEINRALRAFAEAKRKREFDHGDSAKYDRASAHGDALGTMHALYRCGVISDAELAKADRRLERIMKAKVTRRPLRLVKEAA